MDTEIELKFFVSEPNVSEKINQFLTSLNLPFAHKETHLSNCYFDTDNIQLRQLDIGLRIRTCADYKEQTIKTAGTMIGGLNQRPEYNIEIENNIPDLSLFPDEIWQDGINIEEIQSHLKPVFSTDFVRHSWLIDYSPSAKIELAFDTGKILSGEKATDISEIELELLAGNTKHILSLSQQLSDVVAMLPGTKSKAARGYELFLQQPPTEINRPEMIPVVAESSLDETLSTGIQFGLEHLQQVVNNYCEQPSLTALSDIAELLALMRQGFWLFKSFLPEETVALRNELSFFIKHFSWVDNAIHFKELTDKTGNYRHNIEKSTELLAKIRAERQQFPESEDVIALLKSARFNKMQLNLLSFVLLPSRIDESAKSSLPSSITLFAEQQLSEALSQVSHELKMEQSLTSQQYLEKYKLILRSLLTGSWFGHLYESRQIEFRQSWLDIKNGIAELQTLCIIQQHLLSLDEHSKKLSQWLTRKMDSLLLALDHSKDNALTKIPYWH